MSQEQPTPFLQEYDQRVSAGKWKPDLAQRRAAAALGALLERIRGNTESKGLIGRLLGSKKDASGLYLWGDVGRGKSMLMDAFVEQVRSVVATRRVHFHAFMLDVHKRLYAFRQLHAGADLMPKVIEQIAEETRVLCLDELQVTDVTDAMILARLFSGLLDAGVSVVFTSNRPPQDLYKNGLQRDQFVKFIELLQARLVIAELRSPTDYRMEQWRQLARTYVHPLGEAADDFLLESWASLTDGTECEPLRLEVQGRILRVDKHCHGVAWLTFDELCVRPLGANDYLDLAKVCHTVLLQGIPAMTREERNEAKRFVTLIDTLYDLRVKLIATAAAAPEGLYPSGDGSFEFHRTVSRLMEMQSEQYLALPHHSA
jgi:cell division protein ZapE